MAENTFRPNWPPPVDIPQYQQPNVHVPQLDQRVLKTVILQRQDGHGFGFTLRHFIVYPPDSGSESTSPGQSTAPGLIPLNQPMDTVFVKEVRPSGPAYAAGLKTGDRLLAVNGMPVAGTPYARVVAAIQQTPATLKLEVVPQECDLLQTMFCETAHNPETNQRPRIYGQPNMLAHNINAAAALKKHEQMAQLQNRPQHLQSSDNNSGFTSRSKPEPQVPMNSRRRGDDIIQVQDLVAINLGNGQTRLQQSHHSPQQQQQHYQHHPNYRPIIPHEYGHLLPEKYDRRESSSSIASSGGGSLDSSYTITSDLGDSAMSRIRKSVEQKEEFLRRPSQPTGYVSDTQNPREIPLVKHREFYARPNRLQKSIWPPQQGQGGYHNKNRENDSRIIESDNESITSPIMSRLQPDCRNLSSEFDKTTQNEMKAQRIIQNNNLNNNHSEKGKMPLQAKSTNIMQQTQLSPSQQQQQHTLQVQQQQSAHKIANHIAREQFYNGFQPSLDHTNSKTNNNNIENQSEPNSLIMETEDNCRFIPSTQGLHIVSERTKQFESGRPLSPDGQLIDRTSLYRSELSRLSTKTPNPNVALRKREFELKAESGDWRKTSSEENDHSSNFDTTSESSLRHHPSVRARSLSADSTRDLSLKSDRSQVHSFTEEHITREMRKHPCRQNSYIEAVRQSTETTGQVLRRQKPVEEDDERSVRRVSYLRATANDSALQIDSDMDQSPISLQPDTPDTDEQSAQALRSHGSKSKALSYLRDVPADPSLPLLFEGELNIKVTYIDGKRSHDRSWKPVWAEIRGNTLKLTPMREGKSSQSPESSSNIDLRNYQVAEGNYKKGKQVYKLSSETGKELLIQTDNQQRMTAWMDTIQSIKANDKTKSHDNVSTLGSQTAEPQHNAGTTIIQTSSEEVSPIPSSKTSRKVSVGNRSPSGQSPVQKNRKTPSHIVVPSHRELIESEISSPRTSWRDKVVSKFRKFQGQTEPIVPSIASFGVPLSHCHMSDENPHVPYLIMQCIKIVNKKGLDIVGIYRVPGNKAAINALTEQINRSSDDQILNDPKWEDVNVVSSLLKQFIRQLPEGLIPTEMYQHFINADKEHGIARLMQLSALLKKLPIHCYETLKELIKHLDNVSRNCMINLMEPKNLAIVFGPSIVRNEILESAIVDMKHQCRIVEALILYYHFFFENGSLPEITETSEVASDGVQEDDQRHMLLQNVSKIEQKKSGSVAQMLNALRPIRHGRIRNPISLGHHENLSNDAHYVDAGKVISANQENPNVSRKNSEDFQFPDSEDFSLREITNVFEKKLSSLKNSARNYDDDNDESPTSRQPLCLGEFPYVDEASPERPISTKTSTRSSYNNNITNNNNNNTLNRKEKLKSDCSTPPNSPKDDSSSSSSSTSSTSSSSSSSQSSEEHFDSQKTMIQTRNNIISSGDTDDSTTSVTQNVKPSPIKAVIDTEVIREMNQIFTDLEKFKTRLNRSLSLNYKNNKEECCCNNNNNTNTNHNNFNQRHNNRLSLTKDEKTDKNISKKRLFQEKNRRQAIGSRSIKRRHTVGGTHDYTPKNNNLNHETNLKCNLGDDQIRAGNSSPELITKKKEMKTSHKE